MNCFIIVQNTSSNDDCGQLSAKFSKLARQMKQEGNPLAQSVFCISVATYPFELQLT